MTGWTQADAPEQEGRVFVVTGANSGIGYEVARMLAAKKAAVIMACRSEARGKAALARLREAVPNATVEVMALDLADLDSVRAFATAFLDRHPRLDGLINNAGVMALPRQLTAQGFEMQMGVNHLGHFALTARLWPRLLDHGGGRVVNVSSEVHRGGKIRFDDLMGERRYERWAAYTQSKLANLLFTHQLQRMATASQRSVSAYGCHPGYAATELQGRSGSAIERLVFTNITNRLLAQSATMGALPTLRAAVDTTLSPGDYVGPTAFFGARGYPKVMAPSRAARDDDVALRLWAVSEELTGEVF